LKFAREQNRTLLTGKSKPETREPSARVSRVFGLLTWEGQTFPTTRTRKKWEG